MDRFPCICFVNVSVQIFNILYIQCIYMLSILCLLVIVDYSTTIFTIISTHTLIRYRRLFINTSLTLCILMDFPIHIDTISEGLPIEHFKGSQGKFSKL